MRSFMHAWSSSNEIRETLETDELEKSRIEQQVGESQANH